jgi:hypothetical protein
MVGRIYKSILVFTLAFCALLMGSAPLGPAHPR